VVDVQLRSAKSAGVVADLFEERALEDATAEEIRSGASSSSSRFFDGAARKIATVA
jgi:hypothetical protein